MENSLDEDYLSREKINEINDFLTGIEILEERSMVFNYVNNLDDVKEVLFLKYHGEKEDNEIMKTPEILRIYPQIMKDLCALLKNLKKLVELPAFKRELGEVLKISEYQMQSRVEKLEQLIKRDEFPILIIGEDRSGKSTFINLLLGKDWPMSVVQSTRIICEIRNSEEKKVTFTGEGKESLTKDLLDSSEEEIASIVKQKTHVGFTKAIFKYPVNFLQDFTYLVDSPGIRKNDPMEKFTFDFINTHAPAFIFVLDAKNFNGPNIEVRQLIERAKLYLSTDAYQYMKDSANENQVNEEYFEYHMAIFIVNHWDTIKDNAKSKSEVEEVRKLIIEEIKYLWHHSVRENEQIFFLSVRQANEWQKLGIVQNEIIQIRTYMKNLVVDLYQRNVEYSLQLLELILNKMEKKILQKINAVVDKKYCLLYNKSQAERFCQILKSLIKEMNKRKSKIREQLNLQLENLAVKLTEHLKSKDVENKMLNICKLKIDHIDNIEILPMLLRKILEASLYDETKLWEQENKGMENLYCFLNGLFEENILQINKEIKINNYLFSKDSLIKAWNSKYQCEVDKDFITKIERAAFLLAITLLSPFVALASLSFTPLIYLYEDWKINKQRLEAYKKNPENYLRNIISKSLQKLSTVNIIKHFFKNVERHCENHIEAFDRVVTTEMKEKCQLIMDIEKEKREIPYILKSLSTFYYTIENYYGDSYSLRSTCETVKDKCLFVRLSIYDKLFGNENQITQTLVSGKYSVIYKNENYPDVVFKMYHKDFLKANARFQMQEINLLVKGSCKYILMCKHICTRDNNRVLLVLENVDCNLYQFLVENNHLIPGQQKKDSDLWFKALRFILNVSIQLCEGLEYLHSYDPRMVHPDLRLETILVKKTLKPDMIKIFICDACANLSTENFNKNESIVLKMNEDSFDIGGYTKENIYRLGDIFYKLAYLEIKNLTESSLQNCNINNQIGLYNAIESMDSRVEICWREEMHNKLPEEYNMLIDKCLSKLPENRPYIRDCIDILNSIWKNNNE